MDSENLLSIRTLECAYFSNADVVRTLLQQIVLLKDAGQRRVALRDLVAQLIAAEELEAAVSAARRSAVLYWRFPMLTARRNPMWVGTPLR